MVNENSRVTELMNHYLNKGTLKESFVGNLYESTRYGYFIKYFKKVKYDSKNGEYYLNGHMKALERYLLKVELNRTNLVIVDKTLNQEMSQMVQSNSPSMYSKGYLDGLCLMDDLLRKSKKEMMNLVDDLVMKSL